MNEHIESAAAHLARQHRTGFVAGVDFTDDSRFIEWPDSCADEGATEVASYEQGLRQCLGRHVTDKVLAVLFGAAVAFVVLTWGSPL